MKKTGNVQSLVSIPTKMIQTILVPNSHKTQTQARQKALDESALRKHRRLNVNSYEILMA